VQELCLDLLIYFNNKVQLKRVRLSFSNNKKLYETDTFSYRTKVLFVNSNEDNTYRSHVNFLTHLKKVNDACSEEYKYVYMFDYITLTLLEGLYYGSTNLTLERQYDCNVLSSD